VITITLKAEKAASWTIDSESKKRFKISTKYSLNKSNALSLRLSVVMKRVNLI
jgi:hypothetical protein